MTERRRTTLRVLAVFAVALTVFVLSTCPVVFWGDSGEFARRALSVDLSPTARGYPLHRVLCFGAGRLVGDAALGANLVSALFGAVSVALVFEIGRRLAAGSVVAAWTAAAVTGLAHTFWQYAGVAEVYSLHVAMMLAAVLFAVASDAGGARRRFALGLVLGLSLLHHRMMAFALPGLVYWMWTGTPKGDRARAVRQVVAGALVGALPFVALCVVRSPVPPASAASPATWWIHTVFMGGERNAEFLTGHGTKGVAKSAVYCVQWLAFNLPGPALLLAAAGFVVAKPRVRWFLALLTLCHVWFPLQYDWTGDQYTFLIPLYPPLALAAAVAVGWIEARRGAKTARAVAAAAALAPVALYAACRFTDLGPRLLPGLRPEAARATLWPPRGGDHRPREWCAERLASLPQGALLHADWGDWQIYKYLQEAEGMRRDVHAELWNRRIELIDGVAEQWLSVEPFWKELPPIVARVKDRLEPRGDGLFRVVPR